MPEAFALICDSCGEPMHPNLSQAGADGCLWICINLDCPELCAAELETEDLAGGGVSTRWGTGSDVEDKALAARFVRLIDYYEDAIEELHAQGAGHGEVGADAGGGGAPPWPPPRPTGSASSSQSPTTAMTSPRPRTPSVPSPPPRPSAAPPATPPPTPRSASPASTPGCRGCSPWTRSDLVYSEPRRSSNPRSTSSNVGYGPKKSTAQSRSYARRSRSASASSGNRAGLRAKLNPAGAE